jgi:hypothetical protein
MSLMMMTTTLMKIMMICTLFNLDKTFNKWVLTFKNARKNRVFYKVKNAYIYIKSIYVWKRTVVKTSLSTRNKNKRA